MLELDVVAVREKPRRLDPVRRIPVQVDIGEDFERLRRQRGPAFGEPAQVGDECCRARKRPRRVQVKPYRERRDARRAGSVRVLRVPGDKKR